MVQDNGESCPFKVSWVEHAERRYPELGGTFENVSFTFSVPLSIHLYNRGNPKELPLKCIVLLMSV